jgi:hypothetical protein
MNDQQLINEYLENIAKDTETIDIDTSFKGDVQTLLLVTISLPKLKTITLETPGKIKRLLIPASKTIVNLTVTHQQLESFSPWRMPLLERLNLSHNLLRKIIFNDPIQCYPNLKVAILNNNPLNDISTISHSVQELDVTETNISNAEVNKLLRRMNDQQLINEYLKNTPAETETIDIDIPFQGDVPQLLLGTLPKLKTITLETPGKITRLLISPSKTIVNLTVTHQQLESFVPGLMPLLERLNLSHNLLTKIIFDKPVQCYPNLKVAILNNNPLNDISTISHSVQELDVTETNISNAEVNKLPNLRRYLPVSPATDGPPPRLNPRSPDGPPPPPREDLQYPENSHSQKILDEILEGLPKSTTTVNINRVMQGKLKFNLETHGLTNVQKIAFSVPGGVTGISFSNPPLKLRQLDASNQSIDSWYSVNMPYLEELNLSNNTLPNITLSDYPHLKTANLSNNRIEYFSRDANYLKEVVINNKREFILTRSSTGPAELPATLTELKVNNNRLSYLDLIKATSLKLLYVAGNPHIKIVNRPLSLKDLRGVVETPSESLPHDDAAAAYDYEQSLRMYYTLKSKYEKSRLDMLEKAYKSKKMRGVEVRPSCIQCHRPVGTQFIQKKNRKLYARCGDATSPCDLNIVLFAGFYTKVNTEIELAKTVLENSRELIIRHKMDTLFKYMTETESAEKFKLLMDNYDDVKFYHNHYITLYNETYFSEVRNQAVVEQLNKIYDIATDINAAADSAILKYIESYLPEQQQLRELKYEVMEILKPETKEDTNYILYQSEVGPERITHLFDDKPRVIAFVYNGGPKTKEKSEIEVEEDQTQISEWTEIPEIEEEEEEEEEEQEKTLSQAQAEDVFDFETEPTAAIFSTMSRHFRGAELYLRTAIMIDIDNGNDIDSESAETLRKTTDEFDTRKFLVAWYQHFAPEKVDDADNIMQKYVNCESVLFNGLYKKYVDNNWESVPLWFSSPTCTKN